MLTKAVVFLCLLGITLGAFVYGFIRAGTSLEAYLDGSKLAGLRTAGWLALSIWGVWTAARLMTM